MKNILKIIFVLSLYFVIGCQAQPKQAEKLGILVVCHGYNLDSWNTPVREMIKEVHCPYPLSLAFLDFVTEEGIEKAVEELRIKGVEKIRVIPFLFSSYSSHMMEILFHFGFKPKYKSPVEDLGKDITPVDVGLPIEITKALDFDPLIAQVMLERLKELTDSPKDEVLILFLHGTSAKEIREHRKEEEQILYYIDYFIKHGYSFSEFIPMWGSHKPDWDLLQDAVEQKISRGKRVNILAFFISQYEDVDRVIRKCIDLALKNTTKTADWVGYSGKVILPHDNCRLWVEKQINNPKMADRGFYKF